MPRANVFCGSTVSPAENVTYCQPSYAQSTPIIPVTAPLNVAKEKWSGHQIPVWAAPRAVKISTADSRTITPALMAVATPCTLALCRVPRILSSATTKIRTIATTLAAAGDSGTNTLRYLGKAAPSVASDPLPITRNIVQPYRKASGGPKASLR